MALRSEINELARKCTEQIQEIHTRRIDEWGTTLMKQVLEGDIYDFDEELEEAQDER
jgi:hypothetical protein